MSRTGLALIRSYRAWERGTLPDDGGMYDQAASFVHAMTIMDSERAAIERAQQES